MREQGDEARRWDAPELEDAAGAANAATGRPSASAVLAAVVGAIDGGIGEAPDVGDAAWSEEDDRHYRALYEGHQARLADVGYDRVRGAYQYGHLAAQHPDFAGRAFPDVEPELQRRWRDELVTAAGDWEAVRTYVHDAYGHARSEGLGVRRDANVIGSAGSAVDPVELREERAASRSLGGTGTHDRASFADPVPGAE